MFFPSLLTGIIFGAIASAIFGQSVGIGVGIVIFVSCLIEGPELMRKRKEKEERLMRKIQEDIDKQNK